jgi:branched-chain amino acid transport system substrate-binding protein
MKSWRVLLGAFVVLFVLGIGLMKLKPKSDSGELRLGVIAPLSGDFASYGYAMRDAIELAREDLANRGIKTKTFYEDACIPKQAVAAAQRLIRADGVHAIAANFCILTIPSIASIIERSKTPTMQVAVATDSVINSGSFVASTNGIVSEEALHLANLARDKYQAKTASVLYLTTDFGEDYNRYFTEKFEELGGTVVSSDTNPIGINDFRVEIQRVRAKNPEIILLAHSGETLGTLIKQVRRAGLQQPILSVYETEDESVLNAAGDAAEGVVFFSSRPSSEGRIALSFQKRFFQRYGRTPSTLAANAYDGMMLSTKALEGCNKESVCAMQQLRSGKTYEGVSGNFVIKADGSSHREYTLKTVREGKFEVVRVGN